MITPVLQQTVASDGTITWNIIDESHSFSDSPTALAYLQTLPSGSNYMVQSFATGTVEILAII